MRHLIDQARVFPARAAAHATPLGGPSHGQAARTLFICCSDARIVPALITASLPGDLCELRTYGAGIPRYDPQLPTGESRTVEHAVETLEVHDIIVCGHSHCAPAEDSVRHRVAAPAEPSADGPVQATAAELTAVGQWDVLARLDVLSDYPCVAPRLAARTLRLHAWYYDVDTGATLRHDHRANAFLPL